MFTREGDEVPWWWPGVVRSDQRRQDVSFQEAVYDVHSWVPEPSIPLFTGLTAAAAPYVAGAALVAFAPNPAWKATGAAMLFPNPVADAVWFAAGYEFGVQVESLF